MELYPVRYPKALLDAAPEDERTFHLMVGQLANDLNIMTKLLIYSMNPVSDELSTQASTAITMLMIKQLAGRLYEGWKTIKSQFSPLHKKYETGMSAEAKQCLDELKKYFGPNNLVNKIRNKSGFHSDPNLAKKTVCVFSAGRSFCRFSLRTPRALPLLQFGNSCCNGINSACAKLDVARGNHENCGRGY